MRQKKQVLLLGASTLALTAFSFTAGYGLRELAVLARGGEVRWVFEGNPGAPRSLGRIASRNGPTASDRDLGAGQVFYEVLGQLQEQYVEKLPSDTVLASGALDAMLDSLRDPNSRLLEPDEAAAIRGMENGVYTGLGAVLTIRLYPRSDASRERNITVVAPMPGSPAEKAGLLPGDRITEVDGHWIAPTRLSPRVLNRLTEDEGVLFDPSRMNLPKEEGDDQTQPSADEIRKRRETVDAERKKWRASTDLPSVLRQLTVENSGKHVLTIERTGEAKPLTKEVILSHIEVPPVTSRSLSDGVGYVRLAQMNAAAVSAFATAVSDLQKHGARSLVLDLRRNPGGTITETQEIASRLLPSGTVAYLQRRSSERKLVKQPLGVKPDVKHARFQSIAVLVDGGTAGSSEMLAAALRDDAGAKLVGAQTFGDGTEQTLFPLDNGAALMLTTAKIFAPKEGDYDGKGLKPDVAATATPGADRPLEQALHALRPS